MTVKTKPAVHFVSLGCPKNRVDSEVMLGHLAAAGYGHTADAAAAEVIVVNTCGFIDAAKEESIDAIAEMAEHKAHGACRTLVVAGCLSQRYAPDLARELPEVDHFLGTGNFETIAQVLAPDAALPEARSRRSLPIVDGARRDHPRLRGRNPLVPFSHAPDPKAARPVHIPDPDFTLRATTPRQATQPAYSAYLKVSEGCSNTCAFCIIPKLRGPQRSRPIADVVAEAERLILAGATELNLIAQDLCAYGKDLQPRATLAALLRALDGLGTPMGRPLWIRCLYAYPKGLTAEVIEVLGTARHIVPYLDMPLQHISDDLLRRMRRGAGGSATRALLHRLRRELPELTLRTTFITGLPGETEAHFAELCDLVEDIRFERLGAFVYSREADTPAADMAHQVDPDVAAARRDRLMALQQEISRQQQSELMGRTLEVLVEGVAQESDLLLQGRHRGQAPEIDGLSYVTAGIAAPGEVVQVRVDQAGDYDVAGEIVASGGQSAA